MTEHKEYYTVKPELVEVTEEQFKEFVSNYPNKLDVDCCGISDPPLVTYNDFSIATHWPWSIVAEYHAGEPNECQGWDYKRDYKIASNYKEVLTSVSKM